MRRTGGDRIVLDRLETGASDLTVGAFYKLTGDGSRLAPSRVSKARPGAPNLSASEHPRNLGAPGVPRGYERRA
jgi:hypothetical protein